MAEQEHLIEKLTDALTTIGLDIREIKTTLSHFGEKFDRVQQDVNEVKISTKENEHEIEALKLKSNTLENESQETKKDVQILFTKFKEREAKIESEQKARDLKTDEAYKKQDTDRKWLIGTVISIVLLGIAVINLLIK